MALDIVSLIGSVGFPITMCLWFMYRLQPVIENNTAALNKVLALLESLTINKK